mgnify:CR=1 FL=1
MNNITDSSSVELPQVVLTHSTTAVENLYEALKEILAGAKLNSSNIVTILVNLMQIVDKYPKLKGPQKKQVILAAFNMLIDDQNDNVEDAANLKLLVQMTLPSVIDTIVSIDTKQVQIKLKQAGKFIFSLCCGKKPVVEK